jgi:hypothetical protein
MVSNKAFREIALAFQQVVELPHFNKTTFRVNKKIFASLDEKNRPAMLKFPAIEQDVYCRIDADIIYPVPGFWGNQGATYAELKCINRALQHDALTVAYTFAAPKSRANKNYPPYAKN